MAANDDWFRNKDWSPEIEARFFAKLGRARNKAQRLRIQAGYLVGCYPRVALVLLERYFELGEHFDWAQALLDQAEAHLSLGATPEAIQSLQKALQRERDAPRVRTYAWRRYVVLVATEGLRDLYDDAVKVLQENRQNATTFPVDTFLWNAAYALISRDRGFVQNARELAVKALHAAELTHSGFRYHPQVGLVEAQHEELKAELHRIASDIITKPYH